MCSSNLIYSQKHIGNYDQFFVTGTQSPVENIDAFLLHPNIDRDEIVGDYFYRLIQFFEIPNELEKRTIAEAGILLFDYLPHRTFVAAIPQDFSHIDLQSFNIRNITALETNQKIALSISDDEKIALQYYPNLSPIFVKNYLTNKNIEIHEFHNNIHTIVICNTDLPTIANFPITFFISNADVQIFPEYIPGKNIHRSNVLTPQIEGQPQYNGEGIDVAIGDDGMIESHIDFKNRINQSDVLGDTQGSHGEMVAGILAGAGNLDPRMEGTASRATIHMYNEFDAVKNATSLYIDNNIKITSTSYSDGCNRGYTHLAQLADFQIKNNPSLMHVFSAGNTGQEDCGYGAGAGWGNITGGVKLGKNVLAVSNIDNNDQRSSSSSRGPANDGRIKPDISANGDNQFSTQPHNTYGTANGSSAAAPGVAGILAQLYQAYYETHNNTFPNSALIKAAVLNTADDLGNAGPDFSYGFGRINARRALNIIENNLFFEGIMGHTNSITHSINVPEGTQQLKVMLYWNDAEGSTISLPALVNDLDLKVTSPSGVHYLPWILNSSPDSNLLKLPAVRGIDNLNNVEQVTIDLPESGNYSLLIDGGMIAQGAQPYFVSYEIIQNDITITYPYGGEKLVSGEIEKIHWDAFGVNGNFEIETTYNNGLTWELIDIVSGDKRSYLWQVPAIISNQSKIRIKRDGEIGTSIVPFTIFEVPQNIHIAEVCPQSIILEWEPCANTSSYIIYKLGDKYMEAFSSTNMSSIEIPIDNPSEENWYAVAAIGQNGLIGRRSIAISDGVDLLNCELATDISIINIATPSNAVLQSCFQAPLTVGINITNAGSAMQFNVPVFYQIDNQPIVNEMYNSSIPPGVPVNYIFNQKISTLNIGTHHLKIWTAQPNDQANFNDTILFQIEVVPSTFANLPYFQNFDGFENCDPDAECDEVCNLSSGWYNDSNYLSDDTDWITHSGETPTSGTGPESDQNTNSLSGKYLYLEGSRGCTNKESYLLSPCFDLTTATQPIFSFWYHMKGMHIGRLHVDLFDGENWFFNIMPTLTGEQGDDWQEVEIDLTPFATKIVNLRFRGVTGEDYLTDIAIDNVALFDAQSEPYPNFKADKLATCPAQKVHLIDNSVNSPNAWLWKFVPNTVTFIDGTNATDANPVVVFDEVGHYDITLIATNDFGSTQITRSEYIHISKGEVIPYGDDFSNLSIDLNKWSIRNFDNNTTWANTSTIGRDGQPTQAIYMNNHSYNAMGEKDELQSVVIDLTEAQIPYLRFDWAYAQFNSNFADGLEVILSSDCGETYNHVIFEKHGEDLATVSEQHNSWFPQKSHEWKTAKINLSDYIGSSITLQFVNTNGFGNNLFLDNFLVYEYESFPNSTMFFYPEENTFCVGEEAITFITISNMEYEYLWTFGDNATPSSSTEYGPHVVTFDVPGVYHVSLQVLNGLGYDIAEGVINVIDDPIADFSYSLDNREATFTNHSIFGSTYLWDFGDGATSTLENPIHEYLPGSVYTASLTVTNKCGQSTTSQFLVITTGTDDLENNFFIDASPNPTNDFISFQMPAFNESTIQFDIIDARGIILQNFTLKEENNLFMHQLNTKTLPQGMYFARTQVDGKYFVKRFVKVL